jgi:hypothetical protein
VIPEILVQQDLKEYKEKRVTQEQLELMALTVQTGRPVRKEKLVLRGYKGIQEQPDLRGYKEKPVQLEPREFREKLDHKEYKEKRETLEQLGIMASMVPKVPPDRKVKQGHKD